MFICVFVSSWFLHLGTRLPVLGLIRFDLILVGVLSYLALSTGRGGTTGRTSTDSLLRILIAYSVLTIPFVEWPGSVINTGISNFIKGIVFYYFTIAFVRTEKDLKKLVLVFVACQLWRILEPLYLHVTEGYWGSGASMANWEHLDRLSGAPSDVVNPNGLAFIICTVLPFLYLAMRTVLERPLGFSRFHSYLYLYSRTDRFTVRNAWTRHHLSGDRMEVRKTLYMGFVWCASSGCWVFRY